MRFKNIMFINYNTFNLYNISQYYYTTKTIDVYNDS